MIDRCMLAEWDSRFDSVMIAWPHEDTDWASMIDEIEDCYVHIVDAIGRSGQKLIIISPDIERVMDKISILSLSQEKVLIVECPTNDTWTRDYAPLTVEDEKGLLRLVSYKFNGWGLKFSSDRDNMTSLRLIDRNVFPLETDIRKRYVLEGGSIESDGKGAILTTSECMLSINRNGIIHRRGVEAELMRGLGAQRVLWLDHGLLAGDDTDSHIDTLARFAPNDTILYVKSYLPDDPHNESLQMMEEQLKEFRTSDGLPYHLIGLPLPEPIYDEEGERLPATYANFLITPTAILMPTYNQPLNDEMASQMLRIAFPDHQILAVDCRALIRQHGSLHCATMQLPSSLLPF